MALPQGTVCIAGLGLIGGSLARALRESGFCERIIGYGYRETSLARGLELGVIDAFTLDLADALAQSDIIVLCAPTLTVEKLLRELLPQLAEDGPVVTDVASVKGSLHDVALGVNGKMPARLVLAHPIAGSEQSGVEASRADLFVDHRVIITPDEANDAAAVELVRAMWASTGAQLLEMDVTTHDQVLAATSHLPHILAYTLVDALASSADSEAIFRCAAGGFRDFTRIASSDPVMWRDIALANRQALLQSIDDFGAHLTTLRQAVEQGDGAALEASFNRAKNARDAFAASLAKPGQPEQ